MLDDSASGDMSKNSSELTGNESLPPQQFNESHQPNNKLSPLPSSISGIPSSKEGSQLADLPLPNDNILFGNFDSGNGNSSHNLSERHSSYFNQPNIALPLHSSPWVGMPSWIVGPQNNHPQILDGTPDSNIGPGPVTGVGTSSATFSPSLIAKESNRSAQSNSKVNPISNSVPRVEQLISTASSAKLVEKEALSLQGLLKIPDLVKKVDENDFNVEVIFNGMDKYADFVADEHGKKLLNEAETNPRREKKREIKIIHAKKSNKKRPAKELFLRGTVKFLCDGRKTHMQTIKRQEQVIEAQGQLIHSLMSRSNPAGLPQEPFPDDSNGGNSGGDSSGRAPGPGELL